MIFLSDTELHRVKTILVHKLKRETESFSGLFCSQEDFRQWVRGMVGEAIAKALNDIDAFDPERGDFIHWCYLKARKLAERDLRSEHRFQKVRSRLQKETNIDEFINHTHQRDAFAHYLLSDDLYDVLEQLTRDQKHVLSLVYLVGFSIEESAEILKRNRNAVDALIHRAKQKAREFYRLRRNAQLEQSDAPRSETPSPKPRSGLSSDDDEDDDASANSTQWGGN